MPAIDVGAEAIGRATTTGPNHTILGLDNPANEGGEVTSAEMWFASTGSGVKIGTFYNTAGDDYKCRDIEVIGSVTSGSKQTFSGLNMTIVTGDYIGFYNTGGSIENDTTGFAGMYANISTDSCIKDNESTYGSFYAGDAVSLKGIGTTDIDITRSDTGSGVEAVASKDMIIAPDTGSGAEATLEMILVTFETGAGLDALIELISAIAKTGSDTGAGAEAAGILVRRAFDSGVGLEVVLDRLIKNLTDTGVGVDASGKALIGADVGAAVEAIVSRILVLTEAGVGAEEVTDWGGVGRAMKLITYLQLYCDLAVYTRPYCDLKVYTSEVKQS